MAYKTVTVNQAVAAVDIQTMSEMSLEDYEKYIRTGLLTIDHHGILRSEPAGYPIAVTKAQFKALLTYLKNIGSKIGA